MILLGIISGIVPAASIFVAKYTVDGVIQYTQGQDVNIIGLALLWAAIGLVGQLSVIANRMIQGYVADHFSIEINRNLMEKN